MSDARPRPRRIDLFCQVIDNLGDAGVCWRLARQMVAERGWQVRLFVDQLPVLARVAPEIIADQAVQVRHGVQILPWPAQAPDALGDVVVEAFGCRLPACILEAMTHGAPPPCWINLEYLSAESWVEGCHGLPSPDPHRPLTKYFYFPGFTEGTGGLSCERDYDAARTGFLHADGANTFLAGLGVTPELRHNATVTSLFCYADSPIQPLAAAWRDAERPVVCLLPRGGTGEIGRALGVDGAGGVGKPVTVGQLTTLVIPFLHSEDYDRLLCACDLNFVRGEDSFLRAQWACRPTLWQPYRQTEDHHRVKLFAFLDRYLGHLPTRTAGAVRDLSLAWSPPGNEQDGPPLAAVWNRLVAALRDDEGLDAALEAWSQSIRSGGSLLDRLAIFLENRLK